MIKVLRFALKVYLVISLVLSVLVSLEVNEREIINHRRPFIIIHVERSTVHGVDDTGHVFGYDASGNYIGFGEDSGDYMIRDNVTTVFVWNPLNNEPDDILFRLD